MTLELGLGFKVSVRVMGRGTPHPHSLLQIACGMALRRFGLRLGCGAGVLLLLGLGGMLISKHTCMQGRVVRHAV